MIQKLLISCLVGLISSHIITNDTPNLSPKFQDYKENVLAIDQQQNVKSGRRYEHPFMVLITDQKKQCGGAMIKQDIVLTAAHCMKEDNNYNINNFKVQLHRYRLDNVLSDDKALEFGLKDVIIHPAYDFITTSGSPNDIAILKLDNKDINNYMDIDLNNMILLDNSDFSKVNEGVKLLGWGTSSQALTADKKGKPSLVLKDMNLSIVDERKCNFKGYRLGYNLCCQGNSIEDIPCKGDSGSPLFHMSENKQLPVLVGLVSFGAPDCKGYSAFIRISAYLDFIEDNLNNNQKNKLIYDPNTTTNTNTSTNTNIESKSTISSETTSSILSNTASTSEPIPTQVNTKSNSVTSIEEVVLTSSNIVNPIPSTSTQNITTSTETSIKEIESKSSIPTGPTASPSIQSSIDVSSPTSNTIQSNIDISSSTSSTTQSNIDVPSPTSSDIQSSEINKPSNLESVATPTYADITPSQVETASSSLISKSEISNVESILPTSSSSVEVTTSSSVSINTELKATRSSEINSPSSTYKENNKASDSKQNTNKQINITKQELESLVKFLIRKLESTT